MKNIENDFFLLPILSHYRLDSCDLIMDGLTFLMLFKLVALSNNMKPYLKLSPQIAFTQTDLHRIPNFFVVPFSIYGLQKYSEMIVAV